MPVARQILKMRHYACSECNAQVSELRWNYDQPPQCLACCKQMDEMYDVVNTSTSVIGDECDIVVRHGICHEDGSPRRYRFKSEMRRVARDRGLVISGDTPNPSSDRLERSSAQREARR